MRSSSGLAVYLLPLLLLLSLLISLSHAGVSKQAMLLQDVTSLVFTKGEMTNSRRSSPISQMTCKSGHCQYSPSTALCRNVGFDGMDVTWKCEAELPKGVKFGRVEVSCEGYGSRDDDYVLKGSCGLEYSLEGEPIFESEEREEDSWWNRNVRRSAGQKLHPSKVPSAHHPHHQHAAPSTASSWFSWLSDSSQQAKDYAHRQYDHAADHLHHAPQYAQSAGLLTSLASLLTSLFSFAIKLIAALVILYVVYSLLRPTTSVPPPAAQRASPAPSLFRSVLGGLPFASLLPFSSLLGGAPASHPYTAPPPPYPGTAPPPYNSHTYDKSYTQPPSSSMPQQQSQGSGYSVLHGLLGGSLLGYMLGRRRAAPAAAAAPVQGQTVHHVHHNAPPVNPAYGARAADSYPTASTSYQAEVPEARTTETSTAYARTKRR